jgi:hypothetical protein
MMKKSLLLSLVLIPILMGGVAATAAFGAGQYEDPAQPYGRRGPWQGPRYDERQAPEFSEETVTVTGQVYFENRMHPELKSGDEEYELLVPRYYVYEADLKEGQTITVEGYSVTGMPMFEGEEEDEVHLWVTKAIIDGTEYDLERYGRGPMGGLGRRWMGHRGWGPHGGYGPCGPGGSYGSGWGRWPWKRGPAGPSAGSSS